MRNDDLAYLKKCLSKVTLPWPAASSNIPFYVIVEKPRPSLSKHDDERPTYWHVDDAVYLLAATRMAPEMVAEIEQLRTLLDQALAALDKVEAVAVTNTWSQYIDTINEAGKAAASIRALLERLNG